MSFFGAAIIPKGCIECGMDIDGLFYSVPDGKLHAACKPAYDAYVTTHAVQRPPAPTAAVTPYDTHITTSERRLA